MTGLAINANVDGNRLAQAARAEYYRRELSGIRAQAQSDLARRYIELQRLQNAGLTGRAADARRLIRALEYEITTLERLGDGLDRWL